VQLDDDLANRLDQLASEWGTSRSELLSVGAIAVLEAADLIRPTMNFEVLIDVAFRESGQHSCSLLGIARLVTDADQVALPDRLYFQVCLESIHRFGDLLLFRPPKQPASQAFMMLQSASNHGLAKYIVAGNQGGFRIQLLFGYFVVAGLRGRRALFRRYHGIDALMLYQNAGFGAIVWRRQYRGEQCAQQHSAEA